MFFPTNIVIFLKCVKLMLVCEIIMGAGTTDAKDVIFAAIAAGKHVVTANKGTLLPPANAW